ncbi:MAG: hypothetical protein KQ78_00138 [Candidatus Izimaplasma bacterium HR2]|nr:MAG: hypothetical protein KQ78_00138 [Candidatus Izimaplasma bacterium HR2]
MSLTEAHKKFYTKLNTLFFIVLLFCIATPISLSRIFQDRFDENYLNILIGLVIITSFILPAFMLGILRTIKFEQSDSFTVDILKKSIALSVPFIITFGVIALFINYGIGYLFGLYIENVDISELLGIIYLYHIFLLYLFVISRD